MGRSAGSDRSAAQSQITLSVDVEFVRDRRPVRVSLGEWLSWAAARIEQMSANIDQMASEVRELQNIGERLAHIGRDPAVRQLELRAGSLEDKVAELDCRLDDIMASLDTVLVRGRQTERDIDHHSFQREFTSLVNQDIGTLVEMTAQRRGLSPHDSAWLTGRICWFLFGEAEPLMDQLCRQLGDDLPDMHERADRLYEAAKDLRRRIAGHRNQRFDFGFQPDVLIDPSYQEEWPSDSGGDLVEFVVVPSYVVDGYSILSKQRVYVGGAPGGPIHVQADERGPEPQRRETPAAAVQNNAP